MTDLTPTAEVALAGADTGPTRTLARDAWFDLRHSFVFWISAVLIVLVSGMVLFPGFFSDVEHTSSLTGGCALADSLLPPSGEHWFGTDQQGCDVYALSVYGARPSVAVGVIATIATTVLGATVGLIAGYSGGWLDSVLSRVVDVFFGLPLILGGIVALSAISLPGIWGVVFVLSVLGWVAAARIVRSTTIEAKGQDYVLAARALGAGNARIMVRHILPNAAGPGIVIAVLSLGGFIAAEATFSFLGLGIRPPDFSWGTMISDAQSVFFQAPWTLLFPAAFLSATVLAFILLGDAIRDAMDPKFRA
ncbi:MAG: ABC transporter permease [Candidatus Nanopelagicales bacterium]|nr:ABC transporter permease [Candidatus Nanopelagicales bacterium]MDZ4249290.1 ABC transporter permease [Candidatus Nanopelagicales bacterium]